MARAVCRLGLLALAAIGCLIACGSHAPHAPASSARDPSDLDVTLYRDRAVVAHRLEVAIPAAATATVKLRIAAGVDPDDIYIVEKSTLVIRQVRATTGGPEPAGEGCDEVSCVLDDYERPCCARYQRKPSQWNDDEVKPPVAALHPKSTAATEIELVIGAPKEGKYTLVVGYDTDRLVWDAGYTMTTRAAHDRVLLRGAISVRNATGMNLARAHVRVIDAPRGQVMAHVAGRIVHDVKAGDPNSTPAAEPRDLGTIDLVEGDTRVELLPGATATPLRAVLVYDPIGGALDYAHASPVHDPNLGVIPAPTQRVLESFEVDRAATTQHLPAGPVRLLERRADGGLALLGEARLFGAATLTATVDTIGVGTADHVTAKRERRELTIDNDRKRVVEEIAITVDNQRDRAVEVVLREHLYRGENWAIAYWSVPEIVKEGKQQIALRVSVPPKQHKTVLYVVVYSWGT